MPRAEGWEQRIEVVLAEAHHARLRPGEHDCVLFTLRGVDAVTGSAYEAQFRGRYRTLAAGNQIMAELGDGTMRSAATALFDREPTGALWAQRGDPVLHVDEHGTERLGLCLGAEVAFVGLERGLVAYPLSVCTCCWRIA